MANDVNSSIGSKPKHVDVPERADKNDIEHPKPPDVEHRAEKIADKLAHKGSEREQEFDRDQAQPFDK